MGSQTEAFVLTLIEKALGIAIKRRNKLQGQLDDINKEITELKAATIQK